MAQKDECDDKLSAIFAHGEVSYYNIYLQGGAGADTFQISAKAGFSGGTAEDPVFLARISDFDPAEDLLVLSTNVPGLITPTYADNMLLLGMGDGSFDDSNIVYTDVEAQMDAARSSAA